MKPILLALIATLACAAPASAAVRHAAPAGVGTACTTAKPCSLKTALTGAAEHDEVALEAGVFAGGAAFLSIPHDIQLHGVPGGGTSIVFDDGGALGLYGPGTHVRDLRLAGQANDLDGVLGMINGGLVERVEVRATGTNAIACFVRSVQFINVVCAASGQSARALHEWENNGITKTAATVLRNTTLVARGPSSRALDVTSLDGTATKVTLHNTIARGQGVDVRVQTDSKPGSSLKLTTAHSSYASVTVGGTGVTQTDGGTRQLAAPAFADMSALDLRPAAASPTVDAGADDALNGAQDLTGRPRRMGAATDIGAIELAPPPAATTLAPALLDASTARLTAAAAGFGAPTATTFLVSSDGLPDRTIPAEAEGADGARGATLDGLLGGRTYRVRASVTTLGGTATGNEQTVTTPAYPTDPGPSTTTQSTTTGEPPKAALKLLAPTAKRRGKRVEVKLSIPAAGKLRLVLKRGKTTLVTSTRTVKQGTLKLTLKPRRLPAGKLKLTATLTAAGEKATAAANVR